MCTKYKDSICNKTSQCQRKQTFPSQRHQLSKFITRQCCSNPNIEKHNKGSFQRNPERKRQKRLKREQRKSSTKKKQRSNCSHKNHICVFCNEKQSKAHRSIFYIISCNLFSFSFRKIHRCTIQFCQTTNNPKNCQRPQGKKEESVFLCFNQCTPVLTICNHTSGKHNQPHRQFIANHLCNRTTTPQKGIFTISSPSCQQNSINSKTSNSKNIHCSQILITHCTRKTCWKRSPCNLTCLKSLNWCPLIQRLISTARLNRFFQQQFQSIHKRLQNPKKSPHIGSLSTLHRSHNSTLDLSLESNCKQQRHKGCSNHNQQIQNHFFFENF